MSKLGLGLLALLIPLLPACDKEGEDPTTVSIVNKSAEEAADITTEVACEYIERCGILEVSCADCAGDDGGSDCGGCHVELHTVTPTECADEILPDLETGFGCQALTPQEEALVDECLAGLPTAQCTTVEEMEAWVNGGEEEPPVHTPTACDVMEEIMSRCIEHGSDTPPSVPQPG